jgi:hypothetical protein
MTPAIDSVSAASFSARSLSAKDDLVLAYCLPAWLARCTPHRVLPALLEVARLDLDEEEIQEVTWLAQSGNPVQAAEKYITYAIPRATELGERILRDPRFSSTIDAAVLFAWTRSRNDYSLSDRDFPKFLKRYARHKRLTLKLIDAAFDAWNNEPNEVEAEAAPQPDAINFEEMDDAQIEGTYKAVARASARR